MTPALVLADGPTGEAAKSGPWGLAIILLLCAGCYFLFKSMSKHLRKVREEFGQNEPKQPTPAAEPDGETATAQPSMPSLTTQPHATDHAVDQDGEPAPETPSGTPPE